MADPETLTPILRINLGTEQSTVAQTVDRSELCINQSESAFELQKAWPAGAEPFCLPLYC
nr:hypothetical protein [uncultured bacterium]